jgi:hypothetical protein
LWAAALTLVIAAAPRAVEARSVVIAAQLDYQAAPGCPTAEDFEAIVTQRLGYATFHAGAPNVVLVRIESGGRTLEGHLEWRSETGGAIGEQTFPSRTGDCAELARAMGFALALQIQLMAASAAEVPTPPPVAPPSVQLEAKPPQEHDGEAPQGPALLAGAGAFAGVGLASGATGVGRLFAAAAWPRLALELGGEITLPTTTRRADGAGFSGQEFLAALAGCAVRLRWSGCAVAKAGTLRVTGQSVDVPLTASGVVVQTGVRVAFSQPFGERTFLIAQAEGLGRLTRNTVTLDAQPVWAMPRFAALLGINLALRFR